MKHLKVKRIAFFIPMILVLMLAFAMPAFASSVPQDEGDTIDGGPNTIIIELGTEWADKEFIVSSENSTEPAVIAVSPEGSLTLSLDGSYIYWLAQDGTASPISVAGEDNSVPDEPDSSEVVDEPATDVPDVDPDNEGGTILPGIPNQHLFMFGGGLIVAIGALVTLYVLKKRRANADYDDVDDDDFADE